MMIRQVLICLVLCLNIRNVNAQSYPQNYFGNPLKIPMQLVGNFGEIRTNHWHMGLDIRTQQKVNLHVHAAAEGFVSRVVVEPYGFGQAIYIDHPNGFTTLYAHMNAFFPALAKYVKSKQYEMESWKVDLKIPSHLFPLKKGQFIGLSGSTGGSQGPHVHFEIRDTKTEKVLNALLFKFPVADAVPPSIYRLAMYDRNKSTYHQNPQILGLKRTGTTYMLSRSSALKVGSDKISFAIGAVDRVSGRPNANGVYISRIKMDGKTISGFVLDQIGYDETRYMNAHIDYPYKSRGGAVLQHLTPLPGANKIGYETDGDGIIKLNDTEPHDLLIEVFDANKNRSAIRLTIQYDPELRPVYQSLPGEILIPGQVNIFEKQGFELFTTEGTVYDTAAINYRTELKDQPNSVSPLHTFLSSAIPVHDHITVRIKPSVELTEEQAERVIIKNISGSKTYIEKATLSNGWLIARFRQFGSFQAFIDNEAPTVNAPATNLSRSSALYFTPRDNFNNIKNFRAELDGKWLCFSNDKGRTWTYRFDENFPRGSHQLKLIIEDEAGNITTREWSVIR